MDDSSLRIEALEISIHEKDSIIDRLSRELDKAGRQIDAMGAKLQGSVRNQQFALFAFTKHARKCITLLILVLYLVYSIYADQRFRTLLQGVSETHNTLAQDDDAALEQLQKRIREHETRLAEKNSQTKLLEQTILALQRETTNNHTKHFDEKNIERLESENDLLARQVNSCSISI